MSGQILIDTGPLVAFVNRKDRFHDWSDALLGTLPYPLLTCEPVITETCFLLSDVYGGESAIMTMISDGYLKTAFSLSSYASTIDSLMTQYRSVPMSLADACLVKMAELNRNSTIVTIDSDFEIYRIHRNQPIPLMTPNDK